MAKHLIDLDEGALRAARERLGTETIKDTVNRSLQLASGDRAASVGRRLDVLASADLGSREQAWR